MSFIFTITQAGLDATLTKGVHASISKIAFGSGQYTPSKEASKLVDQQAVVKLESGHISDNTLTIQATLSTKNSFDINEVGIFLTDGTLFAIYSHPKNTLAHHQKDVDFEFQYVLNLSGVNTKNITLNVAALGTADIERNTDSITKLKSEKADLSGSQTQRFKVATAVNDDDAANKQYVDNTINKIQDIPVGSVIASAHPNTVSGFLHCNGAEISRTTYKDLFKEISTYYGSGNGSTTFNIPDLRGEFIRGFDDGRGVDSGRQFASLQNYGVDLSGIDFEIRKRDAAGAGNWHNPVGNSQNGAQVAWIGQDQIRVTNDQQETRPRNVTMLYQIKY